MPIPEKLILIYTGNGKGKTTAALGLALRSLRDNKKVILVQFIKSQNGSGEMGLKKFLPQLSIRCFGNGFVNQKLRNKEIKKLKGQNKKALNFIEKIIKKYNIIILDEIFVAYNLKLIKLSEIINIIKLMNKYVALCGEQRVLVLTGRGCPKSLYKFADLITEMKEIKHPYKKGILAIKGVDY